LTKDDLGLETKMKKIFPLMLFIVVANPSYASILNKLTEPNLNTKDNLFYHEANKHGMKLAKSNISYGNFARMTYTKFGASIHTEHALAENLNNNTDQTSAQTSTNTAVGLASFLLNKADKTKLSIEGIAVKSVNKNKDYFIEMARTYNLSIR